MRLKIPKGKYSLLAGLAAILSCAATFAGAIPAKALDGDLATSRGALPSLVLPAVQTKVSNSITNTDATSAAASQQAVSAQHDVSERRETGQSEVQAAAPMSLETLKLQNCSAVAPSEKQDTARSSDAPSVETSVDPLMPASIAQSVSRPDDTQQFDLTPIKIPERGAAFSDFDTYKARMLYRLPARMFFSGTCENSLRLETNVFQTSRNPQADAVYRVLPNLTVGYALNRRTRVSSNFFFFRDQYASRDSILSRNIYSVGLRADRDYTINEKTTMTAGLFCRELFFNLSSSTPALCDIIPSAVVVRRVGNHGAAYASVMGQVRFQKMLDRFQEFDQFYSVGYILRKSPWLFTTDCTFLTNFGNSNLRGGNNNQTFVLTGEIARQLHRNIPVAAFVRAEPIFNMGANSSPGLAGFNFRLYGGLRAEISKPAIFPTKLASK
ncbi:MAG: hypothetical protein IT342_18265 [Candidatus Melainabacteria bacterium]|nr:hypothetical protein [Candidatus Melainabacteria bacterium]